MTGARQKLEAFNASHARREFPYYAVLNIPQSASHADIVRSYRRLSLKLHPDKPGGSNEKFQALSRAYRCLSDPDSRRKYDDCGFDEDNIATDEVDQFVDAFFGESARSVDGQSPDWNTGKIENYIRIDLSAVPLHMKDIVRIGLTYIVSLDHDFENVVLLQHSRVDILYLMVGMFASGPLTQEVFVSELSYTLSYYDNPLQPGITPRWSDQNVLGATKAKKKDLPRRELNWEEFQRRQKIALAMLENAPADPMAALEEKYRTRMLSQEHEQQQRQIEGSGRNLRGQDIYENDAELDCNDYAEFLLKEKRVRDVTQRPAGIDTPLIDMAQEGDSAAQKHVHQDVDTSVMTGSSSSTMTSACQGAATVLGFSSDGVLFVAKGGQVLRNEGPAKPYLGHPCDRSLLPRSAHSQSLWSFHGCWCLPVSFANSLFQR